MKTELNHRRVVIDDKHLTLSYTAASVDAVTIHATLINFPELTFREKDIKPKMYDLIDIELYHTIFLFSISHEMTL